MGDRDLQDPLSGEKAPEHISIPSDNPPIETFKSPDLPSKRDIDAHNAAGHTPFRSWCPVCVRASAADDPHPVAPEPAHDFPIFSSDYAFMGTKDNKEKLTLYIVKEYRSKSIVSIVLPRKGISETEVAINFMLDCIAELGFTGHIIYLKNDQEPAIQFVM